MSIRNVAAAGAASLFAAGLLAACNEVPVASLEKSFTMKVEITEGDPKPVKIDFLWVVDNSTSMCEEQVALTNSFQAFTNKLNEDFEVDAHVAVTTADAQCDGNVTKSSARGVFNRTPATGFTPACYAKEFQECLQDQDCNAAGESFWTCDGQTAVCMVNPNGSLNTSCTFRCGANVPAKPKDTDPQEVKDAYDAAVAAAHQECKDQFATADLSDWYCHMPSANKSDWGCMLPPKTTQCPADLPSILTNENLEYFSCLATVGVIQDNCFKYEQGLKTALWALDPNGPNPEQSKQFLRDDAYLVIIFVTDEDDCSVPNDRPIGEDFYDTCGVANAGRVAVRDAQERQLLKACTSNSECDTLYGQECAAPDYFYCEGTDLKCTTNADCPALPALCLPSDQRTCGAGGAACTKDADCCAPNDAACQNAPPAGACQASAKTYCRGGGKKECTTDADCAGLAGACVPRDRAYCADTVDACTSDDQCAAGKPCQTAITADRFCVPKLDNWPTIKEGSTVDQGGKLLPVSHFISGYKSLKKDPSKVIVAAIAGDSTATDAAQQVAERMAYVNSKSDKRNCYKLSSICNSSVGKSDWGSRYYELVKGFGPNGVFTNICNEEGIGKALDEIANQVVSVVNKICLPHPVKDPSRLVITRTTDRIDGTMKTITMVEGIDGMVTEADEFHRYRLIEDGGDDCKVNGATRPAVQFVKSPNSNEQISIEYEAAPFQRR